MKKRFKKIGLVKVRINTIFISIMRPFRRRGAYSLAYYGFPKKSNLNYSSLSQIDRNSPASRKLGNVMLTSNCCIIDLRAKSQG